MMRIAVCITCHNRRDKTLACLRHLFDQQAAPNLTVYLTDDGSTDDTSEAVGTEFPTVHILQGGGSLFWGGGMRLAYGAALEQHFDAYLWLNDDTHLYPDALKRLKEAAGAVGEKQGRPGLIVGSTRDPETGEHTYGGKKRRSWIQPLHFHLVAPQSEPVRADTANGNIVWIPRAVARRLGNIDASYLHEIGDYDYAFRAVRAGFGCWVAPGFHGTCAENPIGGGYRDKTLPMEDRVAKLQSPAGKSPMREWVRFTLRHAGALAPFYWLRRFVHILFPRFYLWLAAREPEENNQ